MVPDSPSPDEAPVVASTSTIIWLLPMFFGSGCAALMYEILWFQSLQLIVGGSAISLAVLLSTFMGGMCLGSLIFPRLVSFKRHPLAVYGWIEVAIGILGLVLLFALPSIESIYLASFRTGAANEWQANVFLRACVAGIYLLPPTVLMGATLPAISRWFDTSVDGVANTSLFYSANIFGAVVGCLLTSFYLLRLHDFYFATFCAVTLNLVIGGTAILASRCTRWLPSATTADRAIVTSPAALVSYLAIGISGCAALASEVLWTRQLSLLLGATVYTFSLILAVFLVTLGIGSAFGARWVRRTPSPALAFSLCQAFAASGVLWAGWIISRSLPFWPIDVSLETNPWVTFQLDMVRVAWAVAPAAFFWGCSFPIALATAAHGNDPARMVSKIYAVNTLGAIVGAIGCGWFFIPLIGIAASHQVLIALLVGSSVLLMILAWKLEKSLVIRQSLKRRPTASEDAVLWRADQRGNQDRPAAIQVPRLILQTATALALVVLVTFGAMRVPDPPAGLAGYGRYWVTWLKDGPDFLYSADGLSASIAVSEFEDGQRSFHVSGKVVASNEPQDMRLERMLGHLPALLCEEPRSVLIVGCGAGITAGSFVPYQSIERIVICEIEPLIPAAAGEYFAENNHSVMKDERLEIIYDDARHFLLTTDEKFDIITSDPIHPWVKGAAALYSLEYFNLVRKHLKPGGMVTQWVPLYESSLEAVKSEVATFFEAFPNGTVWTNDSSLGGYDVVMLGTEKRLEFDLSVIDRKLQDSSHAGVQSSLEEVGFRSAIDLAKTFAGTRSQLKNWHYGTELNRDRNLHLQYAAGWALNNYREAEIRASMKPFIRYPNGLFSGSDEALEKLNRLLESDSES